ncbi:oxidoreductase [Pigmentiphaga litoralis]|uniref:oxidoreductase n=1 Tax=Pigmentiphaga litoralis TaxID=516702 RepID=UPI0016797C3B|nr:NADH:flavin oxidoreductase [Pigmentiphaga litoralis]GGX19231.1 oxidoreductase [Pigmentiphaga litoralis]
MYDLLSSPLTIGRKTLRNRIVHAPMSVCYADDAGTITDAMVQHYARRAAGGVGMVITENVAVSPTGRQMPRQPGLWDEEGLPGARALASGIKAHGALAVMQIVHAGRYGGPWDQYEMARRVAPSAIPFPLPGKTVTPQEITEDEIQEVVACFARTARLAIDAGFDGVELHAAGGLLISQFLSPRMNTRNDRYGGSHENRCRFAVEVTRAVRKAIGQGALLGAHLMADELIEGGFTLAHAVQVGKLLQDNGCDFLMPVVGTFETLRNGPQVGINKRPLFQLQHAIDIKRGVEIPVIANGGLGCPHTAESILATTDLAAIGLARPLFADPDWANKVLSGQAAQVQICPCDTNACLRSQLTGGFCEIWPEHQKARGYYGFD